MLSIEDIAFDVIEESIFNWYEDDDDLSKEQIQQIYSAVYHKLKCGGWEMAKDELLERSLEVIVNHIEASYAYELDEEENRQIENAKQSKEEALQADADSVKQMELF